MALYTLTPNGAGADSNDNTHPSWDTYSTTGTLNNNLTVSGVLADDDDDSKIKPKTPMSAAKSFRMTLTNATIPDNEQVVRVQAFVRLSGAKCTFKTYQGDWDYQGLAVRTIWGPGVLPNLFAGPTWNHNPIYSTASAGQWFGDYIFLPTAGTHYPLTQTDVNAAQVGVVAEDTTSTFHRVYVEVETVQRPTATITSPGNGGIVDNVSRPSVAWKYADERDADAIDSHSYILNLYSPDQYNSAGFDPATTSPLWTMRTTAPGSGSSLQVGIPLSDGVAYRAYLRVGRQIPGGFYYSEWVYSEFTMALKPPNSPTVTGTWHEAEGRVSLLVQGRSNMLTLNQSSADDNVSDWTQAPGTASLSRVTSPVWNGDAAFALNSGGTATGTVTMTLASYISVAEDELYQASARLRPAGTARLCRVGILWQTSGGADISTSWSSQVTDSASTWTQITGSGTAPGTAARAKVVVEVASPATNETHYVDGVVFYPGSAGTQKNLVTNSTFETDVTGWSATCDSGPPPLAVSRSDWFHYHGDASMQISWSQAPVNPRVRTLVEGLSPGTQYVASAYALVYADNSHHVYLGVEGVGSGQPSSQFGTWQRITYTFTATATSHVLAVYAYTGGSTESTGPTIWAQQTNVDAVQVEAGTTATQFDPLATTGEAYFSLGGMSGNYFHLERSNDGGVEWVTLPGSPYTWSNPATQTFSVNDYGAARGATALYRAHEHATTDLGEEMSGDYSLVEGVATTNDGLWWFKPVGSPDKNVSDVYVQSPVEESLEERTGIFEPLGRTLPVVVADTIGARPGSYEVVVPNSQWAVFQTLMAHQGPVYVQDPMGYQKVVRITGRTWSSSGTAASPVRVATLTYVETTET